jgi:hypothetical protein
MYVWVLLLLLLVVVVVVVVVAVAAVAAAAAAAVAAAAAAAAAVVTFPTKENAVDRTGWPEFLISGDFGSEKVYRSCQKHESLPLHGVAFFFSKYWS